MKMQKDYREILNYFLIAFGSIALSIGMMCFLVPNKIATGGTVGFAIVLHYIISFPIGVLILLINIPLLLIGLKFLGKRFVIKTIVSIVLIALISDAITNLFNTPQLSQDPILATLYGGILIGAGLGFIFKGGGSAGGGSIIAKVLSIKYGHKPSTTLLIIDSIVIFLAAIVFSDIEIALWSLISIYISSRMIDLIIVGKQNSKVVHISSRKKLEPIALKINNQIGINGTIIKGTDLSQSENKDVLLIVVENRFLMEVKMIVRDYDSTAKFIVMEAKDLLAEK